MARTFWRRIYKQTTNGLDSPTKVQAKSALVWNRVTLVCMGHGPEGREWKVADLGSG